MILDGTLESSVQAAVAALARGELLGLPTETVYGLAANADDEAAVARIFSTKGRPANHPLIVHVASPEGVAHYAREVPGFAQRLIDAFWPGPLTLILPRRDGVARAAAGGQESIGLRCPSHPVARRVLAACAAHEPPLHGLAAPSANRFGRVSPTTAAHVREEFGEALLVLDGGACAVGIESTIVDLSSGSPKLLRPGHISPQRIEAACGLLPQAPDGGVPRASGTLEAHYAPQTPMRMVGSERLLDFLNAQRHSGRRCGVLSHSQPPQAVSGTQQPYVWKMLPAAPDGYAHELYAVLRELDHAGVDLIVVEAIPDAADWAAVADRLRRAVHGAGA